ncbi:MAG TPA: pentapeptide repeat-containing protein [Verrucomicrobiae bacterium]|nr:pentapeptide repeat-containing protein [Verrucomicrobiae bacterium]
MKPGWCAITVSLVAGVAGLTVQSLESKQEDKMKPTITSGKQLAEHANLAGSVFNDVNLAGSTFENVNLSKVRMRDINLSDFDLSAAQIGGARFKHIGPPPNKEGKQERQRAVTFEEGMLCDSTFKKVDLSHVKIIDCDVEGMTIDGVLVTDLIAAYKNQRK